MFSSSFYQRGKYADTNWNKPEPFGPDCSAQTTCSGTSKDGAAALKGLTALSYGLEGRRLRHEAGGASARRPRHCGSWGAGLAAHLRALQDLLRGRRDEQLRTMGRLNAAPGNPEELVPALRRPRKPRALSCVSASPFDSVATSVLFPQTPFLLGQSKLVLFLSSRLPVDEKIGSHVMKRD